MGTLLLIIFVLVYRLLYCDVLFTINNDYSRHYVLSLPYSELTIVNSIKEKEYKLIIDTFLRKQNFQYRLEGSIDGNLTYNIDSSLKSIVDITNLSNDSVFVFTEIKVKEKSKPMMFCFGVNKKTKSVFRMEIE